MKFIPLALLLACFCMPNWYCSNPAPEMVILSNTRLSAAFEKAKQLNKGLLLISSKSGCSMCEVFEAELIKDPSYAETIARHFIVLRTDENVTGEQWLSRIINKGSFPVSLFFDASGKLRHLELGALRKKPVIMLVGQITTTPSITADPHFQIEDGKMMRADSLLAYYENVCKAQASWDDYEVSKDSSLLKPMEGALRQSLQFYNTFYNNYLLAKCENAMKDSINGKKYALAALAIEEPTALIFNAPLRTEMKMAMNNGYNVYDDAYMGVEQLDRNIGKVKFKSTSTVAFKIKNLGKAPLVIDETFADCDCTVANITGKEIKPGDTGILNVQFKATNIGEFAHLVQLRSNASNSPMQFTIKGMVLGD
ncbi:DUF1573 domain-containing protein [uncultured Chitinophaga sp.]|uniref:DUF1573 domain-containing protein n=1 Tax=uncultured Chitinophaga sp. TaxID=339340 RepID=UPI0025E675CD|nr:DUF1573 domain-containing protein [uncultured Chitinophaga sp.]